MLKFCSVFVELCNGVNASSFCRRRLPVVMVRSKMAENLRTATQMIEQVKPAVLYSSSNESSNEIQANFIG